MIDKDHPSFIKACNVMVALLTPEELEEFASLEASAKEAQQIKVALFEKVRSLAHRIARTATGPGLMLSSIFSMTIISYLTNRPP